MGIDTKFKKIISVGFICLTLLTGYNVATKQNVENENQMTLKENILKGIEQEENKNKVIYVGPVNIDEDRDYFKKTGQSKMKEVSN